VLRRLGLLLLLAIALLPGLAAAQPASGPLHIHVRGGSEIHAAASIDRVELTLRGELVDDAGAAIPGAPIVVQAVSSSSPPTPLHMGALRPCDGATGHASTTARTGPDEIVIETDERGAFCAVGRAPSSSFAIRLRFRGSRVYDPADRDVAIEPEQETALRALVRFEPPPETIDLDRESVTVTASLRVDRADALRQGGGAAAATQRANLALALEDERGAHVAGAITGGDGRAHFDVKTAALAGPGEGELVARFAGNAALAKASATQPVVRRAEAHVALSHPIDRADPDEGLTLDVDVATGRGPVSGGVVEVRRTRADGAGESVGAATVDEQGHARVVAVFPAEGASLVWLGLRYVPAAPWYRAGPELRVEAKIAGPGALRQLVLAVVVVVAAAWVASGWRRAPRPRMAPGVEGSAAPPSGRAGVRVLASPGDLRGWRGKVADAHDGAPIAGARLSIVAPTFEGDGVVARATADEHGAFTLEGTYRIDASDARLVVSADTHATHEQPLPPPSVLAVALVTRRRALLERLVKWARQRGAPFDGAPEPTPGHVRRAATRAGAAEVEAWAGRVEQAAYGPEPVDEAREREVRSGEPRPAR
jgi:hypothetical protein